MKLKLGGGVGGACVCGVCCGVVWGGVVCCGGVSVDVVVLCRVESCKKGSQPQWSTGDDGNLRGLKEGEVEGGRERGQEDMRGAERRGKSR